MSDIDEQFSKQAYSRVKDVYKDVVWKLGCMMCSYKEIGDVLGLEERTVKRHFGNLVEKARSTGKKSLRRAQFEKAFTGDTRMLIFLGKQYLAQKDVPENGDDSQPLPWEDDK